MEVHLFGLRAIYHRTCEQVHSFLGTQSDVSNFHGVSKQ